MPESNVFTQMSNEYFQLTAAERKVADHVSEHPQRSQLMSISELAEECGVAEATVTRFCRRLGFPGYNAFKLALAVGTAQRGRNNPLSGEVTPRDTVGELCQKLYSADLEALQETMALIDSERVVEAADLLAGAQRVICMGQGGSSVIAQEAAHLFSTARPGVSAVADAHLQAIAATELGPRDVIFYFSYSGATGELMEMLDVAQSCGVKVILVTRFPRSPGAARADVVLQCGSREGPFQLGSVPARMAQLYLIDVVFSEVCRRDMAGVTARREKIAHVLAPKHV